VSDTKPQVIIHCRGQAESTKKGETQLCIFKKEILNELQKTS
jgi:hypothetical protein